MLHNAGVKLLFGVVLPLDVIMYLSGKHTRPKQYGVKWVTNYFRHAERVNNIL